MHERNKMNIVNKYNDYKEYIDHQASKTLDQDSRKKWLTIEWDKKIKWFTEVFNQHNDIIKSCKTGLCVCARMGQEVVALQSFGIDSIGIDLVPNEPYVITGDMHNLPFSKNSFDFVFSNSFDHSLNPEKFIFEIEQVLKPGGYCYLVLQPKIAGDKFAENNIDSSSDVISLFKNSKVVVDSELILSFHWVYTHKLIMRKNKEL